MNQSKAPGIASTIQEYCVERMPVVIQESMDSERLRIDFVANHAQVYTELDHQLRRLWFRLQSYVLTMPDFEERQPDQRQETEWLPVDWWQALRQRFFPRWWLQRWPVKLRPVTTIIRQMTIRRYRVCPHAAIKTTERHLQWLCTPEQHAA